MPTFDLINGSLQHRFMQSRAKVQVYAGGFANGKTSGAVVKALRIARDYPGSYGLVARATYPKLNSSTRRELFKWMPPRWKVSFDKNENTLTLRNGSVIDFRYAAQQGKEQTDGTTTSNLLSTNYDYAIVDQIEDPEFTKKDFDDILGRLRGSTAYNGTDETMPRTGPRWLIVTCNPSRGWFYRHVAKPLIDLRKGVKNPNLMVNPKTGEPLAEMFEGSTYTNAHNLPDDYIEALEAAYQGQMRDRYLLGKWAAYEGLVYPQFDEAVHVIPHDTLVEHYVNLQREGVRPEIIEGFDYGIAVPSCYLIGFTDTKGNTFIVDGYYEAEVSPEDQCTKIAEIRNEYGIRHRTKALDLSDNYIFADPQIFKRTPGKRVAGTTVSGMFSDNRVYMRRGNNDVSTGITKTQGYLNLQKFHMHPIYGTMNAPYLYVSDKLTFFIDEITEYYWKRTPAGDIEDDKPMKKNDHAMDTLKYMLTDNPEIAQVVGINSNLSNIPAYMTWQEFDPATTGSRTHRYG